LLYRIRRFLPNMGGIDISPVILFLVILLLQMWIEQIQPYMPF
jgi:YggT family protein